MYAMKNIVFHNDNLTLPTCMYNLKKIFTFDERQDKYNIECDIDICKQVKKFLKPQSEKMAELEHRQDELLKKLDILYDKIKSISLLTTEACQYSPKNTLIQPEEVVLAVNSDYLPLYLNPILKDSSINIHVQWHIHSSVPSEKLPKIKAFVKRLKSCQYDSKINLRLIFKDDSADPLLKISSLAVPIIGNVNILRYLSYVYPDIIKYDDTDYRVDNLLDICYLLERASDKKKEILVSKLMNDFKGSINNEYSIVDLAAFSVIKQSRNCTKLVSKDWIANMEKICS